MVTKEQMQEAQARLNTAAKALLLAGKNAGPEIREEYHRARRAMQELESARLRDLPARGVPAFPRGKHYPVHEPA